MNDTEVESARRYPVTALLDPQTLGLKKIGREWKGACPMCGGDDRFSIQEHQNTWVCRHCHPRYGDAISYVRRDRHLTFEEAVAYLNGGTASADARPVPAAPKAEAVWKRPQWSYRAKSHLHAYLNHPRRVELWQAHKPIPEAALDRHQFGVGVLPLSRCKHERLIVPVFEGGILVALRGRRIDCDCTGSKWLASYGSKKSLWGLDGLTPNGVVVILENNADAAWLMARYPDWQALAPTTGAGTLWERAWIEKLKAASPAQVVIAYDNDVAGNPNPTVLLAWQAAHPGQIAPLNGRRLQRQLATHGVFARMWNWTPETPEKAGIDWYLENYDVT